MILVFNERYYVQHPDANLIYTGQYLFSISSSSKFQLVSDNFSRLDEIDFDFPFPSKIHLEISKKMPDLDRIRI